MLSGRDVYTFWSLLRNVTDFIYILININIINNNTLYV